MESTLKESYGNYPEPNRDLGICRFMLVCIGLALFSSTSWAQESAVLDQGDYGIFVGDVLEISVWKEPELQRTILVRPDGQISLPLVGDIHAAGRSVAEVRDSIIEKLRTYIPDPVVTVSVTEIRGYAIYVIGQVNNPGRYVVMPTVDVMQALSLAGGTTPFAALNDIIVLRQTGGTRRAIPFRYSDVARGRDLDQNIELMTGDVLVVP